ncbi:papilin-like isoform X1 [Ornithodoros turicata]|uniref:papilin-like isoform X1 n=1 Tax=Ornithodoros turicata TaxID=34597 RepID=UPI003139937B
MSETQGSQPSVSVEPEKPSGWCFVCIGGCLLIVAVVVACSGYIAHYLRPPSNNTETVNDELGIYANHKINENNHNENGTICVGRPADSPACKAGAQLVACNSSNMNYAFYSSPKAGHCIVHWVLNPGCLQGSNRFSSIAECEASCISKNESRCLAPVYSSPCKESEITARQHSYFYSSEGNCTKSSGASCLDGVNRFSTAQMCLDRCAKGDPACRTPMINRQCTYDEKQFKAYFDAERNSCFYWTVACLEGQNRHTSAGECTRACFSDVFLLFGSALLG